MRVSAKSELLNPVALGDASHYVRALIIHALSQGNVDGPGAIGRRIFPAFSAEIQKAAASGITQDELEAGSGSLEFFAQAYDSMLFRKIPGFRRQNFNQRAILNADDVAVSFTRQGLPLPVVGVSMLGAVLESRKCGGILLMSREALEYGDDAVRGLQDDLTNATADAVNLAALDPDAEATSSAPASLTSQGIQISSTSDPNADIEAALNAMSRFADLSRAVFVSDPDTFLQMSNARDSNGNFLYPDLGVNGGMLKGLPAHAFRASPQTSNSGNLTLLDPGSIAYALDRAAITPSLVADLMIEDDFDSNGDAEWISIFQTDSVAFRVSVRANWTQCRPDSVVTIRDCAY